MTQEEEKRLITTLENINSKSYAFNGVELVSGANTVNGDFYGLSVGVTMPDTIKIIPKNNVMINGVLLTVATDIKDFLNEGEFCPIEFTQIITTGTGFVKCYKK